MNDGLTQDDLNEDCPILMQKDFQTTIKNIAELPDYLRKINENIINIDKRISKKELNTDKVKQLNTHHFIKEKNSKCNNDLFELNNIVKQSIEGLYDILKVKKEQPVIIETIEEENVNKTNLEFKTKHKIINANKEKNKDNGASPYNKKYFKKPIHSSKTSKTTSTKPDNVIHIQKTKTNQSNKSTHSNGTAVQKKNTQKIEFSNEVILNNTYNAFVHLTNGQSLKNIVNARGLSSTNDIKSNAINNENNIIGESTSTHNKEKKNNKINNFSFKPRPRKDSSNGLNDVSISIDSHNYKKAITGSIQKANTFKINQIKPKGVNSLHQRLLTEQNKLSSNKNTLSSSKQQDKITIARTHTYSKKDQLNGTTTSRDIFGLMLFLNEYIMSNSAIKKSSKEIETLETISLSLAKALKSLDNDDNIEVSSTDRKDLTIQNDKLMESVLKLQRKWRRYKVKDIILISSLHNENEKRLIKNLIVNNCIEKEGFGAKKLVGMINSSIELFLRLKNIKTATKQLSDIALNTMSNDNKYMLYKKVINKALSNHNELNQSNNKTLRNSGDEKYYNSLLSKIVINKSKSK